MTYKVKAGQFPKDNLYRRLGTRSDISQARIREKYVGKLREFPPETHPEEFRKIREAYEILSNPKTRAEYDASRQSKHSWADLLEAGSKAYDDRNYNKAEALLEKALKIRQTYAIYMMLGYCRLFGNDDLEGFGQFTSQALEVAENEDQVCTTEIAKVICGIKYDRFSEAVQLLYKTVDTYPEKKSIYYAVLEHLVNRAYHEDSFDDTFEIMERLLPERGRESAEDLTLFRYFLDVIDRANRWDRKSMVVSRLKSLAKNLQDEQDIDRAKSMFEEEFDGYEQVGRFREAELVMTFLLELDRHDTDYREWNALIKEKVAIERAYKKLMMDDSIFTGASVFAAYWFYQRCMPPDAMPEELELMVDMAGQMENFNLSETEYKYVLGHGLHQIRKGHPVIYKEFREEWEELLAECTQGLSRRERRALK